MSDTEEPLLVEGQEVEWDRIEEGQYKGAVTVQQLISQDPDHVIAYIKERGVTKLGEFKVPDHVVLGALGDRNMLTIGQDKYEIDYERVWRQELAKAKPSRKLDKTWSRTVTVEAFVVNVKNAAAADRDGLVQPLLKRWQMGACSYSVFGLPALQAVLDFKWHSFARRALYMELACFLVWLLSFSVFGLIFQDEDVHMSLVELWGTNTGKATLICEALAVLAMTPFVIIELSTMAAYDLWGWINLWNALDIATYALQISIVVIHLSRTWLESTSLSVLVATQCVLLWFRLNYFSRVFISSASSFVDSIRQVVVDIKFYLLFLMLMMWGFAVAFCILFRQDQEFEQFSDITHSMLTMFGYALGGVELDIMLASRNPKAAVSLSILYQFAMSMVLMNLLIGIMTTSMEKATKNEDLKLLLSKAEIIDELEATIPKFVERRLPRFYPAYVHVLRVDPKSEEPAPDAAHMWRRQATIHRREPAQEGPAPAGSGDMSTVLSELDTLKRQVQQLNDLLSTAVPSLPSSPGGAHAHSIMSESSE